MAQAALPATHNHTIVTNTSIGGLKLGQTLNQAKAAWGRNGGSCTRHGRAEVYCKYAGPRNRYGFFVVLGGKVQSVVISATSSPGSLSSFKTSKGIGLGATVAALKRAYPGALRLHPGVAYALFAGQHDTLFSFSGGKLVLIKVHAR